MTITTDIDPFADLIASATEREEQEKAEAEKAASDSAMRADEARKRNERERQLAALSDFRVGFLDSVARRVVKPGWSADYMIKIRDYANCLTGCDDKELPDIPKYHAEAILDRFAYGLQLKADHGVYFRDGMMLGQRLLAEREASSEGSKPDRIVYTQPSVDDPPTDTVWTSSSVGYDEPSLPEAITPPKRGGSRRV